jgi:hypothetical protein
MVPNSWDSSSNDWLAELLEPADAASVQPAGTLQQAKIAQCL